MILTRGSEFASLVLKVIFVESGQSTVLPSSKAEYLPEYLSEYMLSIPKYH